MHDVQDVTPANNERRLYLAVQLSMVQSLPVRLKKGVVVISGEIVVDDKNSAILAAAIEPVIAVWNKIIK